MRITKPNFQIKQFLVSVLFISLSAQTVAQQLPRITQLEEDEIAITLDGFVDEPVWQNIPVVDGMKMTEPDTLDDAPYRTEIRFFATELGLYFGIVNHQPADTVVRRLTIRDWSPYDIVNDGVGVAVDASGEGRYG